MAKKLIQDFIYYDAAVFAALAESAGSLRRAWMAVREAIMWERLALFEARPDGVHAVSAARFEATMGLMENGAIIWQKRPIVEVDDSGPVQVHIYETPPVAGC